MNPKLYYVRTKERLDVLPPGRFFFLKKKSWKGISEHVSFSLFHMHSGTKAQANIGWLADVKGEEIRTKKGS